MVRGVGWIGVDLRAFDKLEPRIQRQPFDIIFMHITARCGRVLRRCGRQTVLDNTKYAAGAQRRISVSKELFGVTARHPVMNIAEGQYDIGCASLCQRSANAGKDRMFNRSKAGIAIIGLEFLNSGFRPGAALWIVCSGRIEAGGHKNAAGFRIPLARWLEDFVL